MKSLFKGLAIAAGAVGVLVCFLMAIIVGGVILAGFFGPGGGDQYTVNWYREKMERELNETLSQQDNSVTKKVEAAHGTVTVKQAYVSDLVIKTKDGSNIAGKHGENIRNIGCSVTTRWDGVFHKNGTTVVRITWENINGQFQVTSAKIIHTDALVNMEDPNFWYEVGGMIGLLLVL